MSMSSIKVCGTKEASPETPARATLFGRSYRALSLRFQALPVGLILVLAFGAVPSPAEPSRVIAFGDSLSAGFLLPADAAFPAQLERRLRADGFDAKVVNAGVSGDTTAGGLSRIGFTLGEGADLVILELGANDMLRGFDPKVTQGNLEKIIAQIEARGSAIVLAGMRASGNFGPDYKARFDAVFPDLAESHKLPLYPFVLEGVAGDKALVLADGLHPNAEGVARIVTGIAPVVEENLARVQGAKAAHAVR
jgi:acyl-CoA thioesterase-1